MKTFANCRKSHYILTRYLVFLQDAKRTSSKLNNKISSQSVSWFHRYHHWSRIVLGIWSNSYIYVCISAQRLYIIFVFLCPWCNIVNISQQSSDICSHISYNMVWDKNNWNIIWHGCWNIYDGVYMTWHMLCYDVLCYVICYICTAYDVWSIHT